jgi:hypothetical protein
VRPCPDQTKEAASRCVMIGSTRSRHSRSNAGIKQACECRNSNMAQPESSCEHISMLFDGIHRFERGQNRWCMSPSTLHSRVDRLREGRLVQHPSAAVLYAFTQRQAVSQPCEKAGPSMSSCKHTIWHTHCLESRIMKITPYCQNTSTHVSQVLDQVAYALQKPHCLPVCRRFMRLGILRCADNEWANLIHIAGCQGYSFQYILVAWKQGY